MRLLLTPQEDLSAFQRLGGGKALNLARLVEMGFNVPTWFCLTTDAFEEFISEHHLHLRLRLTHDLVMFSKEVYKLFTSLPLPEVIEKAIEQKLEEMGLTDAYVAVRSSGSDEDSPHFSFAGQFSSYLYQKGKHGISLAIRKCWASGFSERGLSYRLEHNLPLDKIKVGIVIQKMVNAESAGVVFSRHPVKPADGKNLIVSSVWGVGEGLVSGELDADTFEVNRYSFEYKPQIVKKEFAFQQSLKGGVEKKPVPPELQQVPSLSQAHVVEIAKMAVELEQQLKFPQDCEWAVEKGKVYCLQTRPITNCPPSGFYSATINGNNATLWDNSNIIESYCGVTSPLTFSFASNAYRSIYEQFFRVVNIPESVISSHEKAFRNMLGLIRGRLYYNLINWYKLVLLLPGAGNNPQFMETMMGVKQALKPEVSALFDFISEPPQYSLWHKAKLIATTLYRFMKIETIVGDFQKNFNNAYNAACKVNFKKMSLTDQVKYYLMLEKKILKKWQAPIINDCLCMVFFGLLQKLTEKWLASRGEGMSLQNDLLCGHGDIESTEPTKMLMRIAAVIDEGNKSFREWFLETPAEKVWEGLSQYEKSPGIFKNIEEFLSKYGFRCVNELKLEEPDLHDDPTFAIHAIASYIKTGSYSVKAMEDRERLIRIKAESIVNSKLSGWKRKVYYWVLNETRRAIRHRENLRFDRTKIFGVIRHLFRGIGQNLAVLGLIESSGDVFYLTVDEILSYVEGRPSFISLGDVVAIRKREFETYQNTPAPPDRFLTYGAVGLSLGYPQILADCDLIIEEPDSTRDPNTLIGNPCCPGIVEGVVKVVINIKDAQGLNGEILVTERTDPGWVPLYPSCSGLLIERGSLLSHSAVVARELGLPTIVGISGGLMKKLQTGQRVHVDASKGIIKILS